MEIVIKKIFLASFKINGNQINGKKEAIIVLTNIQVRNSKYIFKDLENKIEKLKLNSHHMFEIIILNAFIHEYNAPFS